MKLPACRFAGLVYRAHHPKWACAPLSGEGAKKHGGRFNPPGLAALYTSLDITTAWLEAQQAFPFKAQPMTLVAYRIDCSDIADLTDPRLLKALNYNADMLTCAWEEMHWQKLQPPTWTLAQQLLELGFVGIKVRSFAPGCSLQNQNIVLWRWDNVPPHALEVIDDFQRLPSTLASWRDSDT